MAKELRLQFEGGVYHVISRGNDRGRIVRDDFDREGFLQTVAESLAVNSVILHAFCLMDNHYHLLVETPRGNLATFVRRLNQLHAFAFNRRHRRIGHLFHGRYKALLVERDTYLSAVSRYIHLNPVRVKAAARKPAAERLRELVGFKWSSLPGYLNSRHAFAFVSRETVLEPYGGDTADGRSAYRAALADDLETGADVFEEAVGGMAVGSPAFVTEIAERLSGVDPRSHPAARALRVATHRDRVVAAAAAVFGLDRAALLATRGWRRHVLMDALLRHAALTVMEVARLLGLAPSTVSAGRKRLGQRCEDHPRIAAALDAIMRRLKGM